MERDKSSMTALIAAFSRAYHDENDDPKIFSDTLAKELITDEEYRQIAGYMAGGIDFFAPEKKQELHEPAAALQWVVQNQLAPIPLSRARYCEDMLANAVMMGAKQYVMLGAGMDTFAYRNAGLLTQIHVFEVDHPNTQQFKQQKVAAAGWNKPEYLHEVPVDFAKDNLRDELVKAGFDLQQRTFFGWLGVSYYLTKEQNTSLFKTISSMAPQGSSIVFDYADDALFRSGSKRVQHMVAMAQASGEPMKSCYSCGELERALEEAGLLIYEHLSPAEIEERYFQNRRDDLHAFENISYVLAAVR
ncbi:MAG: SAM-dependent methyltransferase [Paenibacillaceae bacterium]|jgi:methyltransferase (TIGR00027 family)|nr:SAM-dependent methyltransferase [Paenibacillaceae bacterium]